MLSERHRGIPVAAVVWNGCKVPIPGSRDLRRQHMGTYLPSGKTGGISFDVRSGGPKLSEKTGCRD